MHQGPHPFPRGALEPADGARGELLHHRGLAHVVERAQGPLGAFAGERGDDAAVQAVQVDLLLQDMEVLNIAEVQAAAAALGASLFAEPLWPVAAGLRAAAVSDACSSEAGPLTEVRRPAGSSGPGADVGSPGADVGSPGADVAGPAGAGQVAVLPEAAASGCLSSPACARVSV